MTGTSLEASGTGTVKSRQRADQFQSPLKNLSTEAVNRFGSVRPNHYSL
jgi:hypothetical protein